MPRLLQLATNLPTTVFRAKWLHPCDDDDLSPLGLLKKCGRVWKRWVVLAQSAKMLESSREGLGIYSWQDCNTHWVAGYFPREGTVYHNEAAADAAAQKMCDAGNRYILVFPKNRQNSAWVVVDGKCTDPPYVGEACDYRGGTRTFAPNAKLCKDTFALVVGPEVHEFRHGPGTTISSNWEAEILWEYNSHFPADALLRHDTTFILPPYHANRPLHAGNVPDASDITYCPTTRACFGRADPCPLVGTCSVGTTRRQWTCEITCPFQFHRGDVHSHLLPTHGRFFLRQSTSLIQ